MADMRDVVSRAKISSLLFTWLEITEAAHMAGKAILSIDG